MFLDYNQNARDRTVASAYSVRQTGLVSAPLRWDEVTDVDPRDFPMDRFVAERYREVGDLTAGMDAAAGRLDGLLALAQRDAEQGLGDAPWPPHFPKQDEEPRESSPAAPAARPPDTATVAEPSTSYPRPPSTGVSISLMPMSGRLSDPVCGSVLSSDALRSALVMPS